MRHLNVEKVADNIRTRMADDLATARVGGAGLCVMQEGKVVFKEYFGKVSADGADIGSVEQGDRLMFRLASMTKPVTTVASLIQVARGLLDLDTPICKWLPDFAEMDVGRVTEDKQVERIGKAQRQLTLRMLLNHTNGLGSAEVGDREFARLPAADRVSLKAVTDFLSGTALAFEPTTAQAYSGTAAFDVAARLVELTSGMPFAQFIRLNIFDPCGMPDATFAPTDEQWGRFISMHFCKDGKNVDVKKTPGCVFENFPVTWCSGGAGLAATLPDYVKFAEMLCRGGVTENGIRILPAELVKAMGTPTVPEAVMPGAQKWGLGVRVIDSDTYKMPLHCFGWSGAYGSHYWVDPDNQITAVYMKNCAYDGGAGCRTGENFETDVYNVLEQE